MTHRPRGRPPRAPARIAAQTSRTSARTSHPKGGITTSIQPDTPLLYTIPEAAHALRISRTKLYELLTAREIESVYIGRSRKIPATALRAYVDRLRTEREE
jgi:excisionase family DNA binding protein